MKVNSFYSRKLHSLLGVIPLGFFLISHMMANYEAFRGGKEGFIEHVEWINSMPFVIFLEVVGIWLPLLYHGIYGLYIAYESRNNVTSYGYLRNQMFALQRFTGVATLVFIVWHFYDTRFQVALGNITHDQLGEQIHGIVTNPIFFTLYIIGIVSAVFHFSNGMWSFLVSWGITVGPRAQRVSSIFWMGAFVIISTLFILALIAFTDSSFAISETIQLKIN